jgi:predicted DNA-binding transcriptional regulator YafY
VLALDRILEIQKAKSKWHTDEKFHPHEYFRYSFGITQMHDAKPELVELSLTPLQAKYVLSQPLHASQKVISTTDTEVCIILEVYLTPELTMTILGLGSGVKVIRPRKLVDMISKEINEMKKLY